MASEETPKINDTQNVTDYSSVGGLLQGSAEKREELNVSHPSKLCWTEEQRSPSEQGHVYSAECDRKSNSSSGSASSFVAGVKGILSQTNRVSIVKAESPVHSQDPEGITHCTSVITSLTTLRDTVTPSAPRPPSDELYGSDEVLLDTPQNSKTSGKDDDENSSVNSYDCSASVRETSFVVGRNYEWHGTNHSPNVIVDRFEPFRCKRVVTKQSTDGVRGWEGFTSGYHSFEIEFNNKPWGSFCSVGVCTEDADLHVDAYEVLLGRDLQSWGWDIPSGRLYHGGRDIGKFPIGYKDPFPKKFVLTLNLSDSMPNAVITWYKGVRKFKQILFSVLDTSRPLYPAVACCYGNTEVSICNLAKQIRKQSIRSLISISVTDSWTCLNSSAKVLPNDPQTIRPTVTWADNSCQWFSVVATESVQHGIHVWGFSLLPEYTSLTKRRDGETVEEAVFSAKQNVIIGVVESGNDIADTDIDSSEPVFQEGMWGFNPTNGELFTPKCPASTTGLCMDLIHQELQMVVDCDSRTVHYSLFGCSLPVTIQLSDAEGQAFTPCVWYRGCYLPVRLRYIHGPGKKLCSLEMKKDLLERSLKVVDKDFEESLMFKFLSFNSVFHDWCKSVDYQLYQTVGRCEATNTSDSHVCLAHAARAVSSGFHAWKMTFDLKDPKCFSLGIGTSDMSFEYPAAHSAPYVGSCLHSWGWDVMTGNLYHAGHRRGVYGPLSHLLKVSQVSCSVSVVMFLDCCEGQVWFKTDGDCKQLADAAATCVAFCDLPRNVEFHPVATFSQGTASLEYLGSKAGSKKSSESANSKICLLS